MFKTKETTVSLAERITALLRENMIAQISAKTKTNYILATVTEMTGGFEIDKKAHRKQLLPLEHSAQYMMETHGFFLKEGLSAEKITLSDGIVLMLNLAKCQKFWAINDWVGGILPYPFAPPTSEPSPPPTDSPLCNRLKGDLAAMQRALDDAVSDLDSCRNNLGLPSNFNGPNLLFTDNPLGSGPINPLEAEMAA